MTKTILWVAVIVMFTATLYIYSVATRFTNQGFVNNLNDPAPHDWNHGFPELENLNYSPL